MSLCRYVLKIQLSLCWYTFRHVIVVLNTTQNSNLTFNENSPVFRVWMLLCVGGEGCVWVCMCFKGDRQYVHGLQHFLVVRIIEANGDVEGEVAEGGYVSRSPRVHGAQTLQQGSYLPLVQLWKIRSSHSLPVPLDFDVTFQALV